MPANKKNSTFPVLIFFILFSGVASAQDTLHSRFGISFGIADNLQHADFTDLPGIPGCSCAHFTTGDGSGFAISLLYEYPISNILSVGARIGYIDHSATLSADLGQAAVLINGSLKSAHVMRIIDLVESSYGIEPRIGIRIVKGLIFNAGMRIGFVSSSKFIQRDTASEGTFMDSLGSDTKSGVRNQHAGDLPNSSSVLLHGIFSIGYEFALNTKRTTFIVPEISYALALNDIVKGISWKSNAMLYAVAMKFSFN